jgi:hypothetical protein
VEQQAAAEPVAPHRAGRGRGLLDRQVAVPAAVVRAPEDVVEGHPACRRRASRRPAEQREQERLDRDEVRRQMEHARALAERLADEPERYCSR